jgi:hypothetical protein
MPEKTCARVRVRAHPVPDRLGRDPIGRDRTTAHEFRPHRSVGMTVAAGIAHAKGAPIGEADPAGPLHLKQERLHRIRQPCDLEPVEEPPLLDLGPAVPRRAVAQAVRHPVDRVSEAL